MWCWGCAWMSGARMGDTMVLPGWIGNQGDVVEGGRSAEAVNAALAMEVSLSAG